MKVIDIVAQLFGIVGLVLSAISYQEKNNKRYFMEQGLAGFMFFINFLLIGAISAALFNATNLLRGMLFSRKGKKNWQPVLIITLYTLCFMFAVYLTRGDAFQIFLSSLTYASLVVMTILMYRGNGKHIRYGQLFVSSPAWIYHNIFNFSLGGILCELFMMASAVISFVRYGKDGFEK